MKDTFRCHKLTALVVALLFVLGVVLGCLLYGGLWGQWLINRVNHVEKVVEGGFFSVLFSCLVSFAVVAALVCLTSASPVLYLLKYAFCFLFGFYFDVYLLIGWHCYGVLGIIYAVLVLLVEQLANAAAMYFSLCDYCGKVDFGDILHINVKALLVLAVGTAAEILLFSILRILTALI